MIIVFLALGICTGSMAQEADSLMKLVLEQNRELRVAREAYQVAILEAGTGNTPPDPEVEFAYLYGKPTDLENRIDFGVTQQLDFPTAYIHRSKVKKIQSSRAELEYLLTRQEVLVEAQKLWLEQIHLNQLQELLRSRLQQAETIRSHTEQQHQAGELGLLEVGQSKLMLASLEGEYEEVLAKAENNRVALKAITGGTDIEIHESSFPATANVIPDTLLAAYRQGPYARLFHQGLELKEEEKNLAVSQHLPKLMAGYYSESIVDQTYRGFRVGLSVPLWENANTVKKAKTEIAHAEAAVDRLSFEQEKELRQSLNQLETLKSRATNLEEALESANSLKLLTSAMESGEISLSEYFYTSDFYFRNQQQLLRYKRDILVQEAELLKVYL